MLYTSCYFIGSHLINPSIHFLPFAFQSFPHLLKITRKQSILDNVMSNLKKKLFFFVFVFCFFTANFSKWNQNNETNCIIPLSKIEYLHFEIQYPRLSTQLRIVLLPSTEQELQRDQTTCFTFAACLYACVMYIGKARKKPWSRFSWRDSRILDGLTVF